MSEKDKRRRLIARQGMRLVLISGDGSHSAHTSVPPVRIIDSEPRLSGSFRLTDR